MPNMNRLKGKILEKQLTYDDCSKVLGISATSFSQKINRRTKIGFSISEVALLSDLLELGDNEKLSIFFSN